MSDENVGNVYVVCAECGLQYVTGLDSFNHRTCKCPHCGSSKAREVGEVR